MTGVGSTNGLDVYDKGDYLCSTLIEIASFGGFLPTDRVSVRTELIGNLDSILRDLMLQCTAVWQATEETSNSAAKKS